MEFTIFIPNWLCLVLIGSALGVIVGIIAVIEEKVKYKRFKNRQKN